MHVGHLSQDFLDSPKYIFGKSTPIERRLHWILRISASLCFIGHGAWGIITKAEWLQFFNVFIIPPDVAYTIMPLVGYWDITLGVLLLFRPNRWVLVYMSVWAIFTALLRPLAGLGWWEFLERAGNYGAPLALLYLSGKDFLPKWDVRTEIDHAKFAVLAVYLRVYTSLLLLGHAGYCAFQKKDMLISHFESAGLFSLISMDPKTFIVVFGYFEILLAVLILMKPLRQVLLFTVFWKMGTEFLYVIDGGIFWNIWEFVERWGSYGVPFALYYLLKEKQLLKN